MQSAQQIKFVRSIIGFHPTSSSALDNQSIHFHFFLLIFQLLKDFQEISLLLLYQTESQYSDTESKRDTIYQSRIYNQRVDLNRRRSKLFA